MKSRVWKYPLMLVESQVMKMPTDSVILSVQVQRGQICIWAQGNPLNKYEDRVIEMYGTGHVFGDAEGLKYLGTVQQRSFVWHIYERM